MIKQIDPALMSAYREWAKDALNNDQKNGAVLFMTSLPFFKYLHNRDLSVKKTVKVLEVKRMS